MSKVDLAPVEHLLELERYDDALARFRPLAATSPADARVHLAAGLIATGLSIALNAWSWEQIEEGRS